MQTCHKPGCPHLPYANGYCEPHYWDARNGKTTDTGRTIATPIALGDISDVESFVTATIERSRLRAQIAESEREELIAEGITILYELHSKYEPHRAGYATSGRFSGFAAQFLPRRLGDAWHALHPEHRRIAGEDGKRRWHYHEAPISLDDHLSGRPRNEAYSHKDGGQRDHELDIRDPDHWAPVTPS